MGPTLMSHSLVTAWSAGIIQHRCQFGNPKEFRILRKPILGAVGDPTYWYCNFELIDSRKPVSPGGFLFGGYQCLAEYWLTCMSWKNPHRL